MQNVHAGQIVIEERLVGLQGLRGEGVTKCVRPWKQIE
jgi:hypothetical protein